MNTVLPVDDKNDEPPPDPWFELRQFTAARIALGSTGVSVPVREVLQFRLAHAHARDAVFSQLEKEQLSQKLARLSLPVVFLTSQAKDRFEYLQRPDRGRMLSPASAAIVSDHSSEIKDLAIILADGLSAEAVNRHAEPLLALLLRGFTAMALSVAPVSVVEQGRVAIGDDIGQGFRARLSLVLIGERPGLSSPDSLGAYLTFGPKTGLTDESRNCISNIRPEGLDYKMAAGKILYLISEAFRRQLSGVNLKEESATLPGPSLSLE